MLTSHRTTHLLSRPSEQVLLGTPVSRLNLDLERLFLKKALNQLRSEMVGRGLNFRFHVWLSTEWFTPMGRAGFALPFTLADARLAKLEEKHVGVMEGGTQAWCMKLLRHEMGHVVDNVFQLRRRRQRQILFGRSSKPYRTHYSFRRGDPDFVNHLEDGYAQSHPDEDFAETFAVWLTPGSKLKKNLKGIALAKLQYLDSLMASLQGAAPRCQNLDEVAPLSEVRLTVGGYLKQRSRQWMEEGGNPHNPSR